MTTREDRYRFRAHANAVLDARCWRSAELRAEGLTKRQIAKAVELGALRMPRRGYYIAGDADAAVEAAVRLGGRLTCASVLRLLGVFVLDRGGLHVHLPVNASRLRPDVDPSRSVVRHWAASLDLRPRPAKFTCSAPRDLLAHATRCQPPRAAVATIDSALHLGLVTPDDVACIFEALPKKYRVVERLVDGRAESGPETLMRLLLRGVARSVEVQVRIVGVGRWISLSTDGSSSSVTAMHITPVWMRIESTGRVISHSRRSGTRHFALWRLTSCGTPNGSSPPCEGFWRRAADVPRHAVVR